ncbi:hypothetical protein ACFLTT_00820 [Chloroflexota bacterium]
MKHPYFSKIRSFVTYSEVYGTEISIDEIIDLIKSLPVNYWVNMASKSRIFLEYYENKPEYQDILFKYLFPSNLVGIREGFFFHRTQFLVLFRLALFYAAESSNKLPKENECKEITARCLLGINSHLYHLPDTHFQNTSEIKDIQDFLNRLNFFQHSQLTEDEISFVMKLVQIQFHHSWENINNLMGRLKDMIIDIPNDNNFSPSGGNKELLSETFQKNFGFSAKDFISLSFGINAMYRKPEQIFKASHHFPVSKKNIFKNSDIDKSSINNYFNLVSQSRSRFISTEKNPSTINEFSSFMLKPLVSPEDNDIFYPTSLLYLQRLLDSGLIWEATTGEFSQELRIYWGEVFEAYCSKLFERLEINSTVKPKYVPEVMYKVKGNCKRSCDAILIYGDTAVVFEVKIKNLNLIETILKGDFDSFNKDIEDLLIGTESSEKAAKQINRTIEDIVNRELVLPDITPDSIKYFYPVVITLQSWPLASVTYDYVRKIVRAQNILNRNYCADLEIWSCQELEYMENLLTAKSRKPYSLPSIIKQKLSSAYSNLPLEMFIENIYTSGLTNSDYLKTKKEEMFEILKSTLKLKV